jgi:hypothetical protein
MTESRGGRCLAVSQSSMKHLKQVVDFLAVAGLIKGPKLQNPNSILANWSQDSCIGVGATLAPV